jgi:hypothetical protein
VEPAKSITAPIGMACDTKPSSAAKLSLSFDPQLSLDAPISGSTKASNGVYVSGIFLSGKPMPYKNTEARRARYKANRPKIAAQLALAGI